MDFRQESWSGCHFPSRGSSTPESNHVSCLTGSLPPLSHPRTYLLIFKLNSLHMDYILYNSSHQQFGVHYIKLISIWWNTENFLCSVWEEKDIFSKQNLLCNTKWTDGVHNPFVETLLLSNEENCDKLGSELLSKTFSLCITWKI